LLGAFHHVFDLRHGQRVFEKGVQVVHNEYNEERHDRNLNEP
jgi:hypothetical protein